MGVPPRFSSLSFQLRIVGAKNVQVKSTSNLFVRYYLSTGSNKRIQLNTREISSKSEPYCWDESFSLECFGDEDSMQNMERQSVVLELRQRNKVPVLGRMGKSRLLGRAEVPWRSASASEIDCWVAMVGSSSTLEPPALQIQMKVVTVAETERTKRYERLKMYQECGCGCQYGGCDCADYDAFALVAAFEAL